jgi:hypothetical protein
MFKIRFNKAPQLFQPQLDFALEGLRVADSRVFSGLVLQIARKTNLINPSYSTTGSTTLPCSSTDLETRNMQSIVAMAINTLFSAMCIPGHILKKVHERG